MISRAPRPPHPPRSPRLARRTRAPRLPGRALPGRALPALALAAALALVGGCTGSGGPGRTDARPPLDDLVAATADPALRALYAQRIDWRPCPDAGADADGPAVECGTLTVPLDYADPGGRTIGVALARKPAADRDERIGALLVNPGGPGNSGVGMVRWDWQGYLGPLHDRFDLVGFDPRGAGDTTPVHCLDDRTRDEWNATDDPGYDHGRILADACRAAHADQLPHLGTRDSARDLDVLRGALGERRLDFLGLSYGTHLGALYAEEFPDRTGRLVLDGAVEHGTDPMRLDVEAAAAAEDAFRAFATGCATDDADTCPLGTDPAAAPQRLADFLDGLRTHPLRADDGRTLTAALGWTATLNVLYDGHRSWSRLRDALAPALGQGAGDALLELADGANGRGQDGRYTTAADAYAAISCADLPAPTEDRLRPALADLAARAPLTGRHNPLTTLLAPDCRPWPYRTPERPHPVRAPGSAPILVIGSTEDPVTPYPWAQRLAAGLAHGVLLTREGDGHTAYDKSACVRTAVAGFLVDGRMPAAGTHCASD
ncbi:proteinase [Kitasatospora xanthocidica]|uniref:alpha/beta hydrolase n=1 Tax=Kitasatospora xanthocidica TaxID=83382 RepID=UPI001673C935|nr:alpha/beta hydrolase [Kitasatospora xanthocidica]GHF40567.1 proteinase [Kitasatospora xanthocidica]